MKSSDRREQIVGLAIEILANEGIQHVTLKKLAQAAGISEPALYRHFDNKQAILKAVLSEFSQVAGAALSDMASDLTPLEKIRSFVFDRYQRFGTSPSLAKVMFSESAFDFDPILSQEMLRIMHGHSEALIGYFLEGQEIGQIRSDIAPRELFRVVIGSMRLVLQQWVMSGNQFNLMAHGTTLWNAVEKLIVQTESNSE
jgi:AcrR family transcriptional regulator